MSPCSEMRSSVEVPVVQDVGLHQFSVPKLFIALSRTLIFFECHCSVECIAIYADATHSPSMTHVKAPFLFVNFVKMDFCSLPKPINLHRQEREVGLFVKQAASPKLKFCSCVPKAFSKVNTFNLLPQQDPGGIMG